MLYMNFWIFLGLLAGVCAKSWSDDHEEWELFQQFYAKFDRDYTSMEELEYRFDAFRNSQLEECEEEEEECECWGTTEEEEEEEDHWGTEE